MPWEEKKKRKKKKNRYCKKTYIAYRNWDVSTEEEGN